MASSIIPKALNGDISSLNDALANYFYTDTGTDISNLDDIAFPTLGRRALAAGVSPTGSRMVCNIIVLGSGGYRTLLCMVGSGNVSNQHIYYNTRNGSSWAGWLTVL